MDENKSKDSNFSDDQKEEIKNIISDLLKHTVPEGTTPKPKESEKSDKYLPLKREKLFPAIEDKKNHEVVLKFRGAENCAFELLKESAFYDIKITKLDGDVFLAYCKFMGNIKDLDKTLSEMKKKAIVTMGEESESSMFEMFVAIQNASKRKLINLQSKEAKNIFNMTNIAILSIVILVLLFFTKSYLPNISNIFNKEEVSNVNYATFQKDNPIWRGFVLPKYHDRWIEIKKKYGFSDIFMVGLFKTIKDIEGYERGQLLNDLTIYPEAIDRALGLMQLKDIKNIKEMEELLMELKNTHFHFAQFPDNPSGKKHFGGKKDFEDTVILTFFENLINHKKNLAETIIKELRGL